MEKYPNGRFFYWSTKAKKTYSDIDYRSVSDEGREIFLVFGKETKGLPEDLLRRNYESCVRIPMLSDMRSLNLSNAVAIILYEVLRRHDFEGMQTEGDLTT